MSSQKTEILLFAGTTEGRRLAEELTEAGIACTVSVATEYGAQVLGPGQGRKILQGRLSAGEMEELIRKGDFACVVDATHPFATEVTVQIRSACEAAEVTYLRLARETGGKQTGETPAMTREAGEAGVPELYEASSMREAAGILRRIPGKLFITTGSKELPVLAEEIGDPGRLYVRVLPSEDSLKICGKCGIPAGHVIAMQGPFTKELNEAMLRQTGACALLTKESGKNGGFDQKIAAAGAVGIPAVVIRNPERRECAGKTEESAGKENGVPEEKLSYAQTLEKLAQLTGVAELAASKAPGPREYVMIAAGPGDARHITQEAWEAVREADVVFGAPSVVRRALESGLLPGEQHYEPFYKAPQVLPYMKEYPELRKAAVLLSGDTGLYSGAAQLRRALEEEAGEKPTFRYLPGISSVAALAAALQVTWEDAVILSTHGRERDVIGHLRRARKVFVLVSGVKGVRSTAGLLEEAVRRNVLPPDLRIGYGYNLSGETQETGFVSLEELRNREKSGLYILYLENPAADACPVTAGMDDAMFTRRTEKRVAAPAGKAEESGAAPAEKAEQQSAVIPMTKEEVRVLALSRLRLTRNAVFYDIGAGTGSVSVEAARLCPDAQIFAIEKKPEAAALLTENLSKYCLHKVNVLNAAAPECLEDLPSPTHVFIGGSGREMPEILRTVLGKNAKARIVLTCVTLETLSQVTEVLRGLPVTEPQIRQIAVTRAERAGRYHLMRAQNPVFLIDFEGKGEERA